MSHCTTLRREARTTNITIRDWQHDRKSCEADVQDEVVIMASVLMFSLKIGGKYISVCFIIYIATCTIRVFSMDRMFTLRVTST